MNNSGIQDAANLSSAKRLLLEKRLRGEYVAESMAGLPLRPLERPERIPLSYAQQRLWFLSQMEGVSETYHIPLRVRLLGTLDKNALRQALDRIVKRHEALRTTFVAAQGEAHQHIAPAEESRFHLIEHDLLQHHNARAELERLVVEEAGAAFDLEEGPLIRGRLIRQNEEEHALLITMHHIVSDGWSMGVLFNELSELYGAIVCAQEDPLPQLKVQYADYAIWQRRWMEGEVLAKQAEYWKNNLAGAPEVLELPVDRPRPKQQDYAGAAMPVVLSEKLTAGLKELSARNGTTLFMTLLAGWMVLLARLSGRQDVVIGTPVANRGWAEIENLVGFFVNTLVLRLDTSGRSTVQEVLERVKRQAVDAQQHQDIPFEQVVEAVQPVRTLAHTPLFQVMFAWQNAPEGKALLPGLKVLPLDLKSHVVSKFDMTLSLKESGRSIVGGVEYATALFRPETIERYVGYYCTLLEAMTRANDSQTVDELAMMEEGERRQLLFEWNSTGSFPAMKCPHELFEEQVKKRPSAIAIEFGEAALSYSELNTQANQLAHYLRRELGVRPGDRLAICLGRSLEMIVAVLGVWKAGAAYVPLDPAYPTDRLEYMLEDSAPVALLTDGQFKSRFTTADRKLPVLDVAVRHWNSEAETTPITTATGFGPNHLAYIIYTSGSTGMPKGVMVEHRNVTRLFAATQHWFEFDESDVWTLFHSYAFDFSVWEMWGALIYGGRLVVIPPEVARSPEEFWRLVCEKRVTVLNQTPSAFRQLLAAQMGTPGRHNLRYVIFGGEELEVASLRPWYELNPGVQTQLVNMYGITETTVHVTYRVLGPVDVDRQGRSPIGCRIPDLRSYILDRCGQAIPVGVVGELYIGGAGVARGYLNRPELTAERFLPDPYMAERNGAGERMYRTGDLGSWRMDGEIEYVGRNDLQVKVRGFRIELGEIEARLEEYEEVTESVVVMQEEKGGDRRLVAYYIAGGGGAKELAAEDLRGHLAARLPEYMVPAAYVRLEKLPLTINGKLDVKALPAPGEDAYAVGGYGAPQGETEELIAGVWGEVLKVKRIGRQDNFFALGGHSLLAMPVIERMRQAGLHVDVRGLFATQTLAELAASVRTGPQPICIPESRIQAECDQITPEMLPLIELTTAEIKRIVSMVPGGARNVQDMYPLAPLQEGMFFHHLMAGEGDPYVVAVQWSFTSRARLDDYLNALQSVIDRHDILRTAVVWDGIRGPVQVVLRRVLLPVEEVKLGTGCEDVAAEMYARFNPRHYRMDLRQAPLLRIYVTHDSGHGRWLMLQLIHHLVDDNTTLKTLQDEIQAHLLGEADKLPPSLPFRNLVAQTRVEIKQEEHEAYFRKQLGDVEEGTTPFGLTGVHGDGEGIREWQTKLEGELARRLRRCARKLGVSAASVCHVAWGRVVGKVSGREDVVFGTVLFGRMQGAGEVGRGMGLFINTLPVRIHFGEEGVAEVVRRMQKDLTELMQHEHASLSLAQRCSGVPSPSPLFSALLNYRHSAHEGQVRAMEKAKRAWAGIKLLRAEERTNYPVTLSVDDLGDAYALTAQVDKPIEPRRVCEYMNRALESLVESLEREPGRAVRKIDVLPEAEWEQVVHEWNRTEMAVESGCVHELFEEQVRQRPEATAVVYEEQKLSYGELNRRANQLAYYLREHGVKPDERVGICLERGLEMVVALLGVLKAGGAYVPLDPGYPRERLGYMLEDSAPRVLLIQGDLRELFRESPRSLAVVDMTEAAAEWSNGPTSDPERASIGLTPRHLAYIIYTSGSTGTPKGVAVEHRSLANLINWHWDAFEWQSGQCSSSVAGFGFDAAAWEIWPVLCGGGILRMPFSAEARDAEALLAWWKGQKLDVSFLPTPIAEFAFTQGISNPTLQTLLIGGDRLRSLPREAPPFSIVNNYGPTETTVVATSGRVELSATVHSIGRPIANTRVYILDRQGEPVPVGVAGEIYIAGAGVARGYLKRPELTAERFVQDPFVQEAGARMYRTGDLGRWKEDGTIEFLGRNDNQVKMRGFRIELGEIEAQLGECKGVGEAVVVAREDALGEKRLVAYYTAGKGEGIGAEALREYLAQRLPDYMVPAAYMRLEKLPLTANGKLDRKGLPAPEADAYATRGYEAPVGEIETTLAGIWAELLHVERVGRHDDFFQLGGHSLLAVRVIARLRQELGLEVAIRDLFAMPVLADLACAVEKAGQSDLPALEPVERSGELPLSFAQQRLWFLTQMEGVSQAYHIPFVVCLQGELQRAALRQALDRIVERHESLRTRFVCIGGEPKQRIVGIEENGGFQLKEDDLRERGDAQMELQAGIAEEASRAFDLEGGPLIRGRLLRLGEREHVLLITMHHIVSDGWSMGVLIRELSALYGAFVEDAKDPLPELTVQYGDYAVWQRKWMEGEILQGQAEYWKKNLAGATEVLEIPSDHRRPQQQDYAGAAIVLELSEEVTMRVRDLSQRQGTTMYMTLLAVWAVLLGRLAAQEDVVIGTPVANRGRVETEGLIGFFVNMVAVRVDLGGRPTVGELLGRVKSQAIAAQQHQDLPFEQLVEVVQPLRSLAHSPVFQVMFTWQDSTGGGLELAELDLAGLEMGWLEASPHVVSKYDLTLSLQEIGGRIMGGLEYATALFERGTVERYAGYYRKLLEGIVKAGEEQVMDSLGMLEEEERRQVLYEWNKTERELPGAHSVHELFEAQVRRTPDAVAVVKGDEGLCYRELNEQANRLAHYLCLLGVKREERVAICLERSLEIVIAELGVLKAGGAYVPLDPGYPVERQELMISDSGARVLVTKAKMAVTEVPGVRRLDFEEVMEWEGGAGRERENPGIRQESEELAYLMYTSGSTGQPKGVMVPHGAIKRLVINSGYAKWEGEGVAFASNTAFDATTMEIWGPLLNGGRVVVIEQEVLLEPRRLKEGLRRQGVRMMWMTVGLFNQYAEELKEEFGRMRYLMVGGDALDAGVMRRIVEGGELPEHLVNGYGPTETTTFATTHEIKEVGDNERSIPIGRPIGNTRVYIVDGEFEPVGVGVVGEICIGGIGVGRGYVNGGAMTAERFMPEPFVEDGKVSGARMYRTGDLGKWRKEGTIEFVGRKDLQVKVRGFRIELEEIEARLGEYEGIKDAVVVARQEAEGEKRLVAYYTAKGNEGKVNDEKAEIGAEDLRGYLSERLPEYMVPVAYVRLEKLPTTSNGKLNRKALPAPDEDAYSTGVYEAPQGEIEIAIAEIWAEALKVERVGRQDNFFRLGGHSLSAVTVIERIRGLGLQVDVRKLFATSTLAGLAAAVIADAGESRRTEVPENRIPAGCQAITPEMLLLVELAEDEIERIVSTVPGGAANVEDIYPLTPLQEGIFFHHLMGGAHDPYVLGLQMSFPGRDRLDAYVEAMKSLIGRHDILRTAVVWGGLRDPVQVVWRNAALRVEEVELDPAAGDVAEQLHARFNPRGYRIELKQAPLLRIYIAEDRKNDRWLMMLLLHHLAGDHTTIEVMQKEIEAYLLGEEKRLPTPLPFRNFVAQARLGVSREEHEAFFRKMLGDVEEPTAPFGLVEVQGDGIGIEDARIALGKAVSMRARRQARRLSVSAASLFHLAWARVLAQVSGYEDVVFGTVLLGRMQGAAAAGRMMGLFINTLPIRIHAGQATTEASVRRTHALLAELMRHEQASLALAQRCSGVKAPTPLFSSLLNYRHSMGAAKAGSPQVQQVWEGMEWLRAEERTNYPLLLSVDDLGEMFLLTAQIEAANGPLRVCEYMRTALESLVDALENAPCTAVRALPVLGEAERRQVVEEWNQTGMGVPAAVWVHELFEEQARRTPQAVAVECGEKALSYQELNLQANRLAHYLRSELGVKLDDRVGIAMERGLEMMVAVLGIMKAGGAYVPMDPTYPQERLRYLVEDSRPVAVLTGGQERLPDLLAGTKQGMAVVKQNKGGQNWTGWPEVNPEPSSNGETGEHLAYVIYTSGSTGKPKGVGITHRNAMNFLAWAGRAFAAGELEKTLFSTSLNFDLAVYECLTPLTVGGRVRVVENALEIGIGEEDERRGEREVTLINTVPSVMKVMLEKGQVPGTVRVVNLAGEALRKPLVDEIFARTQVEKVCNLYGPTETTTYSTWVEMKRGEDFAAHIGRPVGNTQIYILDGDMEPAPVGVLGEICIGGAGVARGYIYKEAMTAQRFVPDPFAEESGTRMYRTGDLGKWRKDGQIEFLGRNDFQVKIRGFRIELGEIEARLVEHPEVSETVVAAREEANGAKRLVGYVVAKGPTELTSNELRKHLRQRLPEYMVPSAFVQLERLPLTPNGKLDRKKLPLPDGLAIQSGTRFVAPRTLVERQLAEIWEELLEKHPVGVTEEFFELGGHSIMAVRLIARIERLFGKRIPMAALFQNATVESLAQILAATDSPAWSPLVPIQPSGSQPPLFFVHALGGQVLSYMDLSRHLGQDQPFYGLQSRHGVRGMAHHTRLEEMAEEYVAAIRAFQPVGPYRLGGWSMGGVVAFEMARQMRNAGQLVSLVALVDSHAPLMSQVETTPMETSEVQDSAVFALHLGFTYEQLQAASNRISGLPAEERLAWLQSEGKSIGLLTAEMTIEDLNDMLQVFRLNSRLLKQYQGGSYDGTLTLFRAESVVYSSQPRSGFAVQDSQSGWHKLAASVKVIPVAGNHFTLIQEPQVKMLAKELLAAMQP